MPKKRNLRPVDIEYATNGPNQNTLHQDVGAPADSLFRCLADGPAWLEWLGIDVEWTSPEPRGVGTTRTIATKMMTADETFLAWDDGRRLNFRFDTATLPLAAFAEDYLIESTGPDSCVLHWGYAYEWSGPAAAVAGRVFGFGFAVNGRRALRRLAELVEGSGGRFIE